MIGIRNYSLLSGTNYAITDLSALPDTFTADFTAASLLAATPQTFDAKELPNASKFSIQVLITAVGIGLTKVAAKLQCSNVGGTIDACWSDVTTETDCGALVGTKYVTLPAPLAAARHAKFYRLVLTATGGTATAYAVAYGYNES